MRVPFLGSLILLILLTTTFLFIYVLPSYTINVYPSNEIRSSNDWFFLSVGLYENSTHPCLVHDVHCEAEFKVTNLNYTIVSKDGTYSINGSGKTNEMGFFDLYLPRGKNYVATFSIAGKRGSGTISTRNGSSNCITDIKVNA